MVCIDMEMPKSCRECRFFDEEDLCYADGTWAISDKQIEVKPHWCPLIEVKENNNVRRFYQVL